MPTKIVPGMSQDDLFLIIDEYMLENSPPEGSFTSRDYMKHYNEKHGTRLTIGKIVAMLDQMIQDGKLLRTDRKYQGDSNRVYYYYFPK